MNPYNAPLDVTQVRPMVAPTGHYRPKKLRAKWLTVKRLREELARKPGNTNKKIAA